MKTIKVIDIFIKIANNEEVPKKIKFNYKTYIYKPEWKDYVSEENMGLFVDVISSGYQITKMLNEELELIEEEKEIEPLDVYTNAYIRDEMSSFYEHNFETTVKHNFEAINKKINELIIAVNELREGK